MNLKFSQTFNIFHLVKLLYTFQLWVKRFKFMKKSYMQNWIHNLKWVTICNMPNSPQYHKYIKNQI